MRTFEGPRQGARFFFAPRAPWAHSLTLLFVEMFYRLCPREKDSEQKKKHVQRAFLFLLPARPGLTHSRFFLWKCFIGSAPERRTAHRTKKKHVQCAVFFLLPARPGLTHSLVPVVEYYKCWKQKTERTRNKKKQKMARMRSKKKMRVPIKVYRGEQKTRRTKRQKKTRRTKKNTRSKKKNTRSIG